MSASKMSLEERRAYWLNHIEQWQQSGLSRTAYCKQAEIHLNQLCYWINKRTASHSKPKAGNFIPVESAPSSLSGEFKVQLMNGTCLHWSGEANPGYIQQLLKGLEQ